MSTITAVKLVNESAMGIYVMSWTGAGHKRNVISWYEGLPAPMLEFWVSSRGAMSSPVGIRNPQRFGWKTPVKLASFKAFCQRFADEAESVTAEA
jgi:hypothetical protein